MLWDGVLVFIAVLTAVVVWLRWNYSHWKKEGIPYLEPTIIFGNIKEATIGKTSFAVISQQIYNSFPGAPVVGFYRMRTPILQIKDLELIKAVLVSDFNSFRNNGLSINREADPIFGRNPFFLKDDEWKETRRIQTHNHTASKLKTLYGYVEEVKDELISHLNENIGKKFHTLRIYPAGIALNRECNDDTTITLGNKTYEFKKGDLLEIPIFAIHRDPEHFPDPLKFDPERFLNEPNHPALLTFGTGPRACLGSRFAKTQMKAGIAALVQNFQVVPGTNDRSMPTVNNNKSFLISPDEEMSVKFERLI